MVELWRMEETCLDVGRAIVGALGDTGLRGKVGFALVMFDFGDGGNMTYVSNAQRQDMIRALREMITKLEGS